MFDQNGDLVIPLGRKPDHDGNFIKVDFLHTRHHANLLKAAAVDSGVGFKAVPESTTGDTFVAAVLGFIYGIQYNKRKPGLCYESIELSLIIVDEILAIVTNEVYMPWNWANLGLAINDLIDIIAAA